MNKSWNGSCRTRRSPAPRSPDWLVKLQGFLEKAEQETYDAEVHLLVDEFRHQAAAEGYCYSEN